ncbi:hypothetical protein GCM10022223_45730 [Kineosporia mesophila]|uniref:DUF1648 domain-containing protein n=1 Tax=Kineosporia mesophila TaxID=566012 RepID=A0ABP7A2E3_9ACTN
MSELGTALRRVWIVTGIGLVVQLLVAALAWSHLPDGGIVVHYKADGPDRWAGRTEAVLTGPILLLGITVLVSVLLWLFERRPGSGRTSPVSRWSGSVSPS